MRSFTSALLTATFIGLAVATSTLGQMPGMSTTADPTPPVNGFYRGRSILFIHTEASDPKVAGMLTKMMGPKVLTVPSLGRIPSNLLASVYVFRNGVRGEGPFGYQPDVFDSAPSDSNYTPLRMVNLVEWSSKAKPRILRSSQEIQEASTSGEVSVHRSKVVVNMPMLTWPGGKR